MIDFISINSVVPEYVRFLFINKAGLNLDIIISFLLVDFTINSSHF